MNIVFLPEPHKAHMGEGVFQIPRTGSIGIADHSLYPIARRCQASFKRHTIAVAGPGLKDTLTIRYNDRLKPAGYRLKAGKNGVLLEAEPVREPLDGPQPDVRNPNHERPVPGCDQKPLRSAW